MRLDLILTSLLAWGLAVFFMKLARRDLTPYAIVIANLVGYLIWLPFLFRWTQPGDRQLTTGYLYGIGVGLLFVGGNLAFYQLMGTGSVARYAPLTALYVAVPVMLGTTLLRERLSAAQWLGVALALAAGVLLAVEPAAETGETAPTTTGEPVIGDSP